jgi:uncharacterized protein
MRNTIGVAVSGDDFYERPKVINKIKRSLEAGNHVYLSAPRRVGKTSIMNFLKDNQPKGYTFIYEITESVGEIEEFYKVLAKKIIESQVFKGIPKASERLKKSLETLIQHINISVDLPFVKIATQNTDKISFSTEFEKILEELDLNGEHLVIMIDEFPKTLENILNRKSKEEALRFLQIFRDLVHNPKISGKVQFLLTGSIGLPPIVKKLNGLHLITMLNVIEVPPLSTEEASNLLLQILAHYKVEISTEAVETVLKEIDWLIPFHVQLAAQEIIDVYETEEKTIDNALVMKAFAQILHHRNSIYFEIYLERLKKNLETPDYKFANKLLDRIANKDFIDKADTHNLAVFHEVTDTYKATLESLVYDGYINNHDDVNHYRFNSSIFKLWWKKYVC